MEKGFDSSFKIVNVPKQLFIAEFEHKFENTLVAEKIYKKAEIVQASLINLYLNLYSLIGTPNPAAISGFQSADVNQYPKLKEIPNLSEIFGNLDFCSCDHCRSVLSPAAYFVDLLNFLNPDIRNQIHGEMKPIEALLKRRPDLEHITLSCENTNKPIPFIDIVLEVLESFIVYNKTLPEITGTPFPNDTLPSTTSEELLTIPQNINSLAYDKLKDAVFPVSLPFNRDLQVIRKIS